MIRSDSPGLFLHDGAQHGGRGQQQRDPDQQREAVDDGTAQGFRPKDGHTWKSSGENAGTMEKASVCRHT